MKTTTVLLDAGGVILDESAHEAVRVEIAVEVLRGVVPDYSAARLYSDLEEAIDRFCPRILAYTLWKHVGPDRGLFDELYRGFRSEWRERRPGLKLMAGIREELESMAEDMKIGIAGQYGGELLDLLDREAVLDHFAYRFTQDNFDITKPDPRYLEQIAQACEVKPAECIMVGDRIDNDIIPAKQIGMKTILVRVGLHQNQQPRIPFEIPDGELRGIGGLAATIRKVAER